MYSSTRSPAPASWHFNKTPSRGFSDTEKQRQTEAMALKRSRGREGTIPLCYTLLTHLLDSTSSSSLTPRKRRITCASYNDENIDPKSVQDEEVDIINSCQNVLGALEDPFGASRCENVAITKSAIGRKRIGLSTPELNRHSRKGRLTESE